MTYQPHTWTKGETITAQLLQNMDNGVAAAIDALESAFGSNYTMGSKEYKVDFNNLGTNKSITAGAITGTTLTATGAISGATLTTTGAISGTTLTATATEGTGLTVSGETNLQSTLTVGTDNTAGKLIIKGTNNDNVSEVATLGGNVTINGSLQVQGATNPTILSGTLSVDNNTYINSDFIHDRKVNSPGPENEFRAFFKTINLGQKVDSEINSSIINLAGTQLNISNTTTNISSSTTVVEGNLSIGAESNDNTYTNTVIINANSTLKGITAIDKLNNLIVGDSDTTAENKIYGDTTISKLATPQLVVGEAAYIDDEEVEHAAAGLTVLYGIANTDNLIVGNTTVDNDTIIYNGTTTFNTTANILHGMTSIDNLTVNAITLNTGIHINQYASGTDSYGLIVEKNTLLNDMVVFVNNSTQKGFKFQVQETTPSINLVIEPYSAGNKDSTLQFKNSNLILTREKALTINETSLSEDDIKHLHTLWTNYETTQNGGETP